MADYKEKFDEWQQAARRKARELDEKFAISDIVGERACGRRSSEARGRDDGQQRGTIARRGERLSEDEEVGEATRRAAEGVKKAGEKFRDVAGDAGRKAGEVFDDAKKHYERASHVIDAGARFTQSVDSRDGWTLKARDWIKENPGKTAVVTVSAGYPRRRSVSRTGYGAARSASALARTGAAGLWSAESE